MQRRALPITACTLLLLASACAAIAQPVYRIVGPDGKVTFSDRAPSDAASNVQPSVAATGTAPAPADGLPAALRAVSQRYPVTLYTAKDCAPCTEARNLLVERGIPFTERTVQSNADIDAFKRLSGDSTLPFATVGSQQVKGYASDQWTQYLDAAGYPKQSALPSSYRRAPATPLAPAEPPAAEASAASKPGTTARTPAQRPARPAAPVTPPPAGTVTPSNPAGLRF